ncbi:MAG: hypothetical protein NTY98_28370 [Verrucomicrobia bacterium]|nr:hypothetical protein [Verrucomicrobiota bacterium]
MKTYGHSIQVHFLGTLFPLFMGWLAYRSSVDEFVNGGTVVRIALVTACVMLALFSFWLYWKSSINRYRISDSGLVVLHLWSSKLIPWTEIDEIVWKRLPHCVFIKGKGRTLVFTSTDIFDELPDLLTEIARRSQCKLSSNLEGIRENLFVDDKHQAGDKEP